MSASFLITSGSASGKRKISFRESALPFLAKSDERRQGVIQFLGVSIVHNIRPVSRVPLNTTRMPASAAAFIYMDPSVEHYKDCLEEQTTLGGKLGCFLDHKLALASFTDPTMVE